MSQLVYIYSLMIWELLKWVNKMKKIYCELHLFDLNQTIYIVDLETGYKAAIAVATMEELPEVIRAVSNTCKICDIMLSGNSVLGNAVAEDILAYNKIHYGCNNINVEVLK